MVFLIFDFWFSICDFGGQPPGLSFRPATTNRKIQIQNQKWGQPCFCLWRGFLQITRTTFSRLTILQLSQSRLTDARTFMVILFLTVGNAAFSEVVRGHFDPDDVAWGDTNEEQSHPAGNVRHDALPVFQFNSEHGLGQRFDDLSPYFNSVFLRHVNTSGASFVIKIVCSKWAEGRPSRVTTVHLSSRMRTSG
jgi:hypothetical protein